MLLCCVGYLKRNSKMKNKEQHIFPFLERLLDGAEVEWKPLGEVAELKRGTSITKKTSKEGKYPVISGGQQPAYYIDTFNRDGETITVAGSGAYAGFVMFWNEPIFVSDAFSIKTEESLVLPRYVYHFLLNIQGKIYSLKTGSGVPHVYAKDVGLFLIPIPCPSKPEKSLEIQRKIVDILDKFMTLEAELDCRKRQYEYYRNQLLSLEVINNKGNLNNVEVVTLGEIVTIKNGKTYKHLSTGNIPVYGSGGIMCYVDQYVYDKPTVLIPRKGSLENIFYLDKPFWNVDTIYYTEIKDNIIMPKFLYHYLINKHLENLNLAGGVPSLTQKVLNNVPVPIPPLAEQQRIVSILDKFEALTTSISEGLPKEIELRRKQYEYYRNQLLSFA